MTTADVSSYRWLVSPQAEPWLALAAASSEPLPRLARQLRGRLSPLQTHLVLEQVELRRRAAAKFSQAEQMFFTRRALEQATSERVACWKAARFRSVGAPSSSAERSLRLADLCCGIGGDLLALGQVKPTVGIERDEATALLARANLAAIGDTKSQVCCADVSAFSVEPFDSWHLDPDRRTERGRVAQPDWAEPGLDLIERLLVRREAGAVKLAPAARMPEALTARCEREWIGEHGECKQQVAWFGPLARRPGLRSATVLARSAAPRTVAGEPGSPPIARALRRFVYEPDAAVRAAELSGALAEPYALEALAAQGGYLTGDQLLRDPAMPGFEVLEALPFDRKHLKALLRRRDVGRVEIKKRGVELDVPRLERELRGGGDNAATLLITPLAGKTTAILARRL